MKIAAAWIIALGVIVFGTVLAQSVVSGQRLPEEPIGSLQHGGTVVSIAFSRNGKTLASGGEDSTIRLWDVRQQRQIGMLQGHTDEVWSVAFSPKGEVLASASRDKTIRLWDVREQKQIGLLEGHTDGVLSVDFSPGGEILASASMDKTIRLWDVHTQEQIGILEGHTEFVYCANFSPDGRTLASTSWDGDEILWDVQKQKQEVLISGRMDDEVVVFSPDGKIVAIGGGWMHDLIRLWDVDRQEEIGSLGEPVLFGHTNTLFSIAFSPDGELLASGGWKDKAIHFWDVGKQEQVALLAGHTVDVWSIDFSPGGRWFASADDNGTILLWEVNMPGMAVEPRGKQSTTWGRAKNLSAY